MKADETEMAAQPVLAPAADSAWEAVVWPQARLLYRVAYSVLRHPQDAEDAVQETLQRAWKYRHRLEQVEDPAAWLARIAFRAAAARRVKPAALVAIEDLPEGFELRAHDAGADDVLARRQMKAMAAQLIEHLPAKLRQPLVLSTVAELNARQIGAMLGIPETSVRTRCLRARRLLREKMEAALRGRGGRA